MSSRFLVGVLPVVQLPYLENEAIDFETLKSEIDWLIEQGANGLATGMVTELIRLTTNERMAVAESVCQATADRGPVVIGVGAESTYCAVELARHAEEVGAMAVMAIQPMGISPTVEESLRYFERFVKAIKIPVIVQDASGYLGRPLGIATMARLLDTFGPERILFKPEAPPLGPHLSALREATAGKARVFEGSGGISLVDSYRRGIVGTMPGADLIVAIVALWKALQEDDDAAIYEISGPLSALVALQSGLDGFLAVEKYLLVKQGVFRNSVVRGPVSFTLDDETRREVDRLFERLSEVVAGLT